MNVLLSCGANAEVNKVRVRVRACASYLTGNAWGEGVIEQHSFALTPD